jgi:predicted DNA binding CopG/RHH family protein
MKIHVSYRLSSGTIELIKAMAEAKGLSQASVIELVVRETARREKFPTKPPKQ